MLKSLSVEFLLQAYHGMDAELVFLYGRYCLNII
jgi:hypothetical protein